MSYEAFYPALQPNKGKFVRFFVFEMRAKRPKLDSQTSEMKGDV